MFLLLHWLLIVTYLITLHIYLITRDFHFLIIYFFFNLILKCISLDLIMRNCKPILIGSLVTYHFFDRKMADREIYFSSTKLKKTLLSSNNLYVTFICIISLLFIVSSADNRCGNARCVHGTCRNASLNQCECLPGWIGQSCNSCGGRLR